MTSETGQANEPGNQAELADRLAALELRLSTVERSVADLVRSLSGSAVPDRATTAPQPPPPPLARVAAPTSATAAAGLGPPASPPIPPPAQVRPRYPSSLTTESVLKWAGIALVALAALFFVSTAISRGWIGPTAQLAIATVAGLAMIGSGWRLREDARPWALALTHGGIVVLGICGGAAHLWLDLIGLGPAVVAVSVIVAVAIALALMLEHSALAITGLAVGLAVPGAIGAYDEYGMTFTGLWFLGLVAVASGLSFARSWPVPRMLSLVVVGPLMWLVASIDGDATTGSQLVLQLVVVAAGLLWWAGPWLRPAEDELKALDWRLVLVIPGLVWLVSQQLWAVSDEEVALVAGIVAGGFALLTAAGRGAARAQSAPSLATPLLLANVIGISVVASAGLGLWLDGPSLLLTLAAQAVGVAVLATLSLDRWLAVNAAALWAVVGGWTAAGISEGIEFGLSWQYAVAYVIVLASAGVLAAFARLRFPQPAGAAAITTWIGLLLWIMAVVGPLPQGQMIVSMIWAVLGGAMVVIGLGLIAIDESPGVTLWPGWHRHFRQVGLATLTATVLKLVTIDLAEVDTIWRAGLFAVIGLGLLRLGFSIGLLSRRQDSNTGSPGQT